MAGGWAKDGAVSEQIEASINDELSRLKARKVPIGASLTHCAECEEPISEPRRLAVVGVVVCSTLRKYFFGKASRLAQLIGACLIVCG